jgi:Uma2 family endonuclease
MASASPRLLTAEDLFALPDNGGATELVRGELIDMSPGSPSSSEIGFNIGAPLWNFVRPRRLGVITGELAGYVLARNPDTVRAPDIAFVRADRVPPQAQRDFYWQVPPDLAVEIVSPSDRPRQVRDKCLEYLDAGVRLVWLVEPKHQRVTVYLPDRSTRTLGRTDALDGGDVLPGFTLPLADVFD